MLKKYSLQFIVLILLLVVTLNWEKITIADQSQDNIFYRISVTDSASWSEPLSIPLDLKNRNPIGPKIFQSQGSIYSTYQTISENTFPKDVWVIKNRSAGWSYPQKVAETSLTLTGSRIAVTEEDGREVYHLIWSDQPSDSEYDFKKPPAFKAPNYILYSNHNDKSESWSLPDTLYCSPQRVLTFSPDLISKKESLYFVFSAFDSTDTQNSGYKNFLMIRKKNHWMSPIAVATFGGDADMEILDDGTFIYSYIRPDTAWVQKNLQPDVNSVFVKKSSDGGKTWNESLIQRSGRTPAYGPNIEVDGSGKVHLFWQQDTDGNRRANDLAHSWSANGGDKWTDTEMIIKSSEVNSGFIQSYDVVATNTGMIHLLFVAKDGMGSSTGRMYHAYWNGNSWNTSGPLFDFSRLSQFSLAYDESRKQIHLVFMAIPNNQDQEALWRLYHSVFQD